MKKILVADDEVLSLSQLAETLQDMGHEVLKASSGEDALSLAKARRPDLVIMEAVLPGPLDGLAACERIQTDLDITVVLLASYSDEAILARARKARPYGFILKPVRDGQLRASIELVADKKGREKNLERMIEYYRDEFREKELLFAVFENLPFGALLLDGRGRAVYANLCFSEITGFDLDEVKSEEEFVRKVAAGAAGRKKTQRVLAGLARNPGGPAELSLRRKDGAQRDMEVRAAVLKDGGVLLTLLDVTERNRAAAELATSREQFRAIADYTPDWESWLGTDGRPLWVNPAVQELTGYCVAECLAMPDYPLAIVHEEDRAGIAEGIAKALAERGSDSDRRFRVRRKDGALRWVAASWQSIQGEAGQWLVLRVSARDITRRKAVEDEFVLASVYNRGLFEANPDPLANIDAKGRIKDANPALEAAAGLPRQRLLGLEWAGLTDDPARARSIFSRVLELGTMRDVEISIRHPSGRLTHLVVSLVLFRDAKGQVAGVLASGRDVSERKRAEALRADIERIARHDLKAPLGSIISVPKLLRTAPNLTEDHREILDELEATGRRMLRMINLSLDLYRMEAGTYAFTPAKVDLLTVLRDVAGELAGLDGPKGCAVEVGIDGRPAAAGESFLVLADDLLCHSLFGNLLKNAVEASPPREPVRVELSREAADGGVCVVRLANRGAIPSEVRGRMFEKYATAGKAHGSGLGAYSARLMAETMRGSIAAETSDEDDATTVSVRLPAA